MFSQIPVQALAETAKIMSQGLSRLNHPGPVKWCHACHRVHRARACNLVEGHYIAKSGRKCHCWVHPKPSKKKTKARKS